MARTRLDELDDAGIDYSMPIDRFARKARTLLNRIYKLKTGRRGASYAAEYGDSNARIYLGRAVPLSVLTAFDEEVMNLANNHPVCNHPLNLSVVSVCAGTNEIIVEFGGATTKKKATPKINFPAVAKRLRKAAAKELANELYVYSVSQDADMRKIARGDNEDTLRIANWIERGKPRNANIVLGNMDTAARETVGNLIAATSPAYYMAFLVPDGWRSQ